MQAQTFKTHQPQHQSGEHAPLACSIIDAQGRETPITEHMIQHACHELEKLLVRVPSPKQR